MMKRLFVAALLTVVLAVGTGVGTADAKPAGRVHGFQACMATAHVAFRGELAAGVAGAVARRHLHDAQAKCRLDYPRPRGR